MPREARFFEMFARPSQTIVAAAHALDQLLKGVTSSKGGAS
ncbi:hypothetical protein RLEG12_05340 (plasmid) [Rhizobium leguminosarum bv. trifolii CB782]|nr:hypothetical protein RLEG12_05340 [Rhizobium leguminosarum bv. trifolii CB782]